MGRNEAALTANAASLGRSRTSSAPTRAALKPEAIDAGIDEARRLLLFTLALFIGWTAVPAVGSLIVGRWMRRLVEPEPVPPSEPTGSAPTVDSVGP